MIRIPLSDFRLAAALGLLAYGLHAPVMAAQLCDGQCAAVFDFASGGSIETGAGATIVFGGTDSGLQLGDTGSIDLGDGGSITPTPAADSAPDMSAGGTIVLGPNGAIRFGNGGLLNTGDGGQITVGDDSNLNVLSAQSVEIDSDGSVYLGTIETSGDIIVEGDEIRQENLAPINLAMRASEVSTVVSVRSSHDVTFNQITGGPNSVTFTANSVTLDGGDISADGTDGSDSSSGSGGSGSSGSTQTCHSSGSGGSTVTSGDDVQVNDPPPACDQSLSSGGPVVSDGELSVSGISPLTTNGSSGAFGELSLLVLILLNALRTRKLLR